MNAPFLPGRGRRSWKPGISWRAWHCCESLRSHLSVLSRSVSSFLHCLSSAFIDWHFICWCPRVLKAMWGRRVTLGLPVQLDLQDQEENQGKTEPKATLWVFVPLNQWLFLALVVKSVSLWMSHNVFYVWMAVFAHRALLDSPEIQVLLEKLVSMWVLSLLSFIIVLSLAWSNMIYFFF